MNPSTESCKLYRFDTVCLRSSQREFPAFSNRFLFSFPHVSLRFHILPDTGNRRFAFIRADGGSAPPAPRQKAGPSETFILLKTTQGPRAADPWQELEGRALSGPFPFDCFVALRRARFSMKIIEKRIDKFCAFWFNFV